MTLETVAPRRRLISFSFIRQFHLWIGAWGAVAAILFGFTGFIQNHRAVMKLPQGDSTEVNQIEVPVPEAVRETPEALRDWLHDDQHLGIDGMRVQPGRPVEFNGQRLRQPTRWNFTGGTAMKSVQAEYTPGADRITVHTSRQSPLAVMSRLHKGIGGGIAWILLGDSFALSMITLGVTGLILWGRRRPLRQMLFSVVGLAVMAIIVIGGGLFA